MCLHLTSVNTVAQGLLNTDQLSTLAVAHKTPGTRMIRQVRINTQLSRISKRLVSKHGLLSNKCIIWQHIKYHGTCCVLVFLNGLCVDVVQSMCQDLVTSTPQSVYLYVWDFQV